MAETGRRSFPDHHKILGLQRVTFFLALIIALLVIVGAVGGGVGGSIAAKKKSSVDNAQSSGSTSSSSSFSQSSIISTTLTVSSSTTPFSTSTSSSASPTNTPGYTGCPGINGTVFTAPSGAQFMQYCYYDIVGTNADFQVHTFVNNFNDCIGLCDTVNVVGQSTECKACSYDYSQVIDYLDCWLKNGTNYLELDSVSNPPAGDYSVIAILL